VIILYKCGRKTGNWQTAKIPFFVKPLAMIGKIARLEK
jgi:hypothetical protein